MSVFLNPSQVNSVNSVTPFKERMLFPIASPRMLLASSKRQQLISRIHQLAFSPEELFAPLYQDLIDNFVQFVQVIPSKSYGRLGSLMDEGLYRAIFALETLRQEQVNKEIDPLMAYVLFCAALLFDIGYVTENRVIAISNRSGDLIKLWQPHLGCMSCDDGYYKIRSGGGMPPWLSRRVVTIFAKQIIPPLAFNWMAQNPTALNTWIALMHDEKVEVDGLKLYLDRAGSMLEAFKLKQEFLMDLDIKGEETPDTALGEDFLEWLQKGLGDNSITINAVDSNIHTVSDGVFMEVPGIFREFSRFSPTHPAWSIVLEQFVRLGFIIPRGVNLEFEKYYFMNRDVTNSEPFGNVIGQMISRYGIREGLTVRMPYYFILFCIRFYPYLNRYLRIVGDIRNRLHPSFKAYYGNLNPQQIVNIRNT